MLLPLIIFLLGTTICSCLPSEKGNLGSRSQSNGVQFLPKRNLKFLHPCPEDPDAPVRGVNLGGWLLLEPFITPSLFEAFRQCENSDEGIPVDEYHYTKALGQKEATERLEAHWQTWITKADIKLIKKMGFNLIRIPVGYWAFETLPDDPYVSGPQEAYLDKAIEWASRYGLKVWVDLHGAAGSQNGFDNSGLRDHYEFQHEKNLNVTRKVIHYLLDKYSRDEYVDTVVGVQLINEPLGPVLDMDKLKKDYYLENYNYLRKELGRDQIIVIHDAFQPLHYWDNFFPEEEGFSGVLVDHHHYAVFDSETLNSTFEDRLDLVCSWGTGAMNETHPNVAGELSGALTDCTQWLNGVGYKARYDGTLVKDGKSSFYIGSCENNEDISLWSQERKDQTRHFLETQLNAFELTGGWILWTFKTENSIEWDARKLASYGLLPQPLDDRKFPSHCKK